jgi:predicted aspartyl protease
MGVTHINAVLRGPTGVERQVRFLVDSGATYSMIPHGIWQDLGLEATRSVDVVLADGTVLARGVSECFITLPGLGAGHSPVFLGEPGDEALLGVITLENMGLVLNPYTRTLHPMKMMLA